MTKYRNNIQNIRYFPEVLDGIEQTKYWHSRILPSFKKAAAIKFVFSVGHNQLVGTTFSSYEMLMSVGWLYS